MRKCPVAEVLTLFSVLPVAAHNIVLPVPAPFQGQMHLLSNSSELMLLQHNARQVTVTKPRARTTCYTGEV